MSNLKSKHAFGSEINVDAALEQGLIDAYDVLFLSEGKVGWIDANGKKVILEDKKSVVTVESLPTCGQVDTVYICNNKLYFWNGCSFSSLMSDDAAVWEDM